MVNLYIYFIEMDSMHLVASHLANRLHLHIFLSFKTNILKKQFVFSRGMTESAEHAHITHIPK